MNELIAQYLSEITLNAAASPEAVREAATLVEETLGLRVPLEYIEFLLVANGGEGPIGPSNWLRLWPAEELVEANVGYGVPEFAPELFLFATNGGGTLYAFDQRTPEMPIYAVEAVDLGCDQLRFRGNTFAAFLNSLYSEVL